MTRLLPLLLCLALGCQPGVGTVNGADAAGGDDMDNAAACVPGQQIHCGCPGGADGVQVCREDGSGYEACDCGTAGADVGADTPDTARPEPPSEPDLPAVDPCLDHCVNGVADCGESGVDCGGAGCPTCVYTEADCLDGSPRAGSEICDDEAWRVPDDTNGLILLCLNDNGGVVYIANNTGPTMSDGVDRCQGWEESGQNAWDHLDYVYQLTCDEEQKFIELDLSGRRGDIVYSGAHWDPATYQEGGGHMTWGCITYRR